MNIGSTEVYDVVPTLNPESARQALEAAGKDRLEYSTSDREVVLENASGESLGNMAKLLRTHHKGEAGSYVYEPEDTWVVTPLGSIKLDRLEFKVEVGWMKETIRVESGRAVEAIVVDVLENRQDYVSFDGEVWPVGTAAP